jgi:uncharacterized membrane protein
MIQLSEDERAGLYIVTVIFFVLIAGYSGIMTHNPHIVFVSMLCAIIAPIVVWLYFKQHPGIIEKERW